MTNGIDMTIKRFFLVSVFMLKGQLLSCLLVSAALAQLPLDQAMLSNQIQQLLKVNNEMVDHDAVNSLSEKIINDRQHYSNDMLAKVYLLSARVASNQGNINKVFEYSQNGLAANSSDKKIHLALLLKLADVYLARKQYKRLLKLTQVAVSKSELSNSLKYQLLSLSYRSVAFSMLGHNQQALADLQQVEQGISKNELTEHTELLTILALAYHHLSDYQTSLTMQLKILKLKFEMGQKTNIAQTYLYLGYAYFYLRRFDDAYNAFWESKKSAKASAAAINIAHANKGLGLSLIAQKQFKQALEPLEQAVVVFNQHNMFSDYTESLTALASVKLGDKNTIEGYALLAKVVELLNGKDISLEYPGFYRMVAEMHFAQKNYQTAYRWREKYSQILFDKLHYKKTYSNTLKDLSHLSIELSSQNKPIEESKRLALKLAKNSELSSSFVEKYQKQHIIIIGLSTVVCLFLLIFIGFSLRVRAQKYNKAYEDIEKPSYVMDAPLQTKFKYQLAFKKAKKFQYPLSVGYLVIDNWQELIFHFNRKTINEVTKDIASVINEKITEFDYAGLLIEGKYLLLFEHQTSKEANEKLDKLVQAVNSTAFASLGDFSVTMKYTLNMPDFKDIDPYLFLARIAQPVNID